MRESVRVHHSTTIALVEEILQDMRIKVVHCYGDWGVKWQHKYHHSRASADVQSTPWTLFLGQHGSHSDRLLGQKLYNRVAVGMEIPMGWDGNGNDFLPRGDSHRVPMVYFPTLQGSLNYPEKDILSRDPGI